MERTKTYRVQEFAQLAGVTVRTLHYYEQAGLLPPSSRTSSGHRRYRQSDLLRLQQILTLKYLGFALDEIQALLAAPAYDVATALQAQKAALEGQILRLQQVVYALTRISTALEQAQALDWDEVIAIIRGLSDADRHAWLSRYFPPDQWAWLQERAAAMPPEAIQQGTDAWQELYAAFREHVHLSPEHPDVQTLAAQMDRLIRMFTQDKPEIEEGLKAFYQDEANPSWAYRGEVDPNLQELMIRALNIYRAQGGNDALSDS